MKYITFSPWALLKKTCPEGQHAHPNNTKCHPITLLHRPGSKAEAEHIAMGLPTKDNPTQGLEGDKEPKKPEETKEDDGKIKPYTEGEVKPEGLQYTMGFTRTQIEKSNPEYMKKCKENAQKYKTAYEKINWDNVNQSNVNDTVRDFLKEIGNGSRTCEFNFGRTPEEVEATKQTLGYLNAVMQEYPFIAGSLNGFDTTRGKAIQYISFNSQTISFNHDYFARGDEPAVGKQERRKDPQLGEYTDWKFHFDGSTYSSSIQHELGHLYDLYVTSMVQFSMPQDWGAEKYTGSETYEDIPGYKDKLKEILPDALYDRNGEKLEMDGLVSHIYDTDSFSHGRCEYEIYLEDGIWLRKGDVPVLKKQIRNACKQAGIKGIASIDVYSRTIQIKFKPIVHEPTAKLDDDRTKVDMENFTEKASLLWYSTPGDNNKFREKQCVDRIKECEEVYKEIFNLNEIVPSEVYSGYGYYGQWRDVDYSRKAILKELQASERVAEAMEDIMVRKDKANSMSQILIAHLEYEMYQCVTGDFKKSFRDFIINDVGLDKFKERIVKFGKNSLTYINFNAIAKRCPPGYHIASDGCRRVINGRPIGELYTEAQARDEERRQSKPKKKKEDSVLCEYNKIVDRDSKEGKVVLAMRDGQSDEAIDTRIAYIGMAKELGYYPVVLPIDEFKSYGKTFDGKRTTYDVFVDENGEYPKARKKLHDKIISDYLKKMTRLDSGKQIAMFLGGGSASGKGSMDSTLMEDFGITDKEELESFKIDPDAIMELLPEYKQFPPELRASACHREASDIAEELFYLAMRNRVSFIYDGTFSSEKPVKFAKSVDKSKYKMLYRGINTDVEECIFFSNKRFAGDKDKPEEKRKNSLPRLVPEAVVRTSNQGARDIRAKYVTDTDLFDDSKVFTGSEAKTEYYKKNKDTYFNN